MSAPAGHCDRHGGETILQRSSERGIGRRRRGRPPLWQGNEPWQYSLCERKGGFRRLDQAVGRGVSHDIGRARQPHLLQEPRAIGADGFRGEMQLVGRFLHTQAGAEAAEHFELAVGETFMRHSLEARVDEGGKPLGECVTHIPTSPENAANGIEELGPGMILGDISGGACAQGAHRELVLGMNAQYEDLY